MHALLQFQACDQPVAASSPEVSEENCDLLAFTFERGF
jgi:hypothetical protein